MRRKGEFMEKPKKLAWTIAAIVTVLVFLVIVFQLVGGLQGLEGVFEDSLL